MPSRFPHVARLMFGAILLACSISAQPAAGDTAEAANRPNFVILLADDLGYGDLACYGHPVLKTPHIDRLARDGLRLTNCYAAATNCSPSRAGLMTGRTPFRAGIHNWIPMYSPMHLRREEITIATLLRRAGYATCQVGKWHLNGDFNGPTQPQPNDHGFDYWFATQNNALPNHHNPNNFVRNGEPVGTLKGYSGQLVAAEAIHWLRHVRNREKPFFLYACFHEPHEPIATDPRFASMYDAIDKPSQRAHHGNISQLDDAVGRVLAALDELGLRESTLVFFTSDNGPAITSRHPHGSAGPLRGKKGEMYEGGIRVPGILRWPPLIREGQVSDQPISGVDVLPTFCQLAGVPLPRGLVLDGASFVPLLRGQVIDRTKPLYWQYNRARSEPKVALRQGNWKILATLTGPELKPGADLTKEDMDAMKQAELDEFQLYELGLDVAEEHDLAGDQPQQLNVMLQVLRPFYREVRDETPIWPSWKWPRYEAQRIEWGP